jgi:hypothetical protein
MVRFLLVKVTAGGAFADDEAGKYEGEQRSRLQRDVRAGVREAQIRYYFEVFGSVAFP